MRQFLLLGLALLLTACAEQAPRPESPEPAKKEAAIPLGRIFSLPRVPARENPLTDEAAIMAAVNDENSVFFASGEMEVNAEGRAKLQRHAQRLKADDKLVATLIGQTDDQGSGAYNLAVSEQRAEATYKVLRGLGVPATQLRRYGVGAEKVSKACQSPECRRKMRRVEIRYE